MSDIFEVHGITFIRTGECRQCGACGCAKLKCPHFAMIRDKANCDIYDAREQYCEECGMTHQSCIKFPDNPWIDVVRDGTCSYTFVRQGGGSMDRLPFLYGEQWYRGE